MESYKSSSSSEEVSGKPLVGDDDVKRPKRPPLPKEYEGDPDLEKGSVNLLGDSDLDDEGPDILPLPRQYIGRLRGEHDIVPLYDDTDSVLSDEPPPPIPPKPTDSEKSPPPRPESPADSDLSLPSKASSDSKRRPLSVHDGDTVDGWKPSPKESIFSIFCDEEPVELQAIPPPLVHEEPETEAETSFITPGIQDSVQRTWAPIQDATLKVGMKEKSSTGEVYEKKVYPSGRHAIGPDHHFRQFSSVAHFVEMDDLAIATVDKLQFVIQCTFQYFLRRKGDAFPIVVGSSRANSLLVPGIKCGANLLEMIVETPVVLPDIPDLLSQLDGALPTSPASVPLTCMEALSRLAQTKGLSKRTANVLAMANRDSTNSAYNSK
uniref:Uncharacterized protein LOC102805388 n=1 Tax=Saccoglossus kowalevskii TaxID=10224 RepID=A0ABM0MCS1_SACKO|nr:PREDICTED: uncharacterized protein LOC102805388 [Saccoglossus kowalevskii]